MRWAKTGHHKGISSPNREQARELLKRLKPYKANLYDADVLITEAHSKSIIKEKLFIEQEKDVVSIEDFVEYMHKHYPELLL